MELKMRRKKLLVTVKLMNINISKREYEKLIQPFRLEHIKITNIIRDWICLPIPTLLPHIFQLFHEDQNMLNFL
jgi:hypothetical protein